MNNDPDDHEGDRPATAAERMRATPDSMTVIGPDVDLGEPLWSVDDAKGRAACEHGKRHGDVR